MSTPPNDDPAQASAPATPSPEPARKPYAPPTLRRLGSVRELTLGATIVAKQEGVNTYRKSM